MLRSLAIVAVLMTAAAEGAVFPSADSARGQRIFSDQSCIQCHSINGEGAKIGPDLGRRIDRNYTPAMLVSIMWNHAPTMWAAMEARGIGRPALDEQAAADLFAYFYSARFFDKLGDAGGASRRSPAIIAPAAMGSRIRKRGPRSRWRNGNPWAHRLTSRRRCGIMPPT